jgi:hypothetical protein
MSANQNETPPAGPETGQSASQIASDLTGLPLIPLAFRTLVDTLIFTPRVARDIVRGTRAYFSPLRLFISLMGLQFGIAAFFGLPAFYSLEALLAPAGWDLAEAHLAEQGLSFTEVSATVGRWGALLNWPLMAVGAIPYLVVIKAFRPSLSWWTHFQCYLSANNAMLIVSLLCVPALLLGELAFLATQGLSAIVFFIAIMRVASGAYGLKPLLLAGFLLVNLIITVPSTILMFAAGMFSVHLILQWNYDLSLFELMSISLNQDSRPLEASPPPLQTEE